MNLETILWLFSLQVSPASNLHGGEDKHDGKVDGDDGLKEESLEINRGVAHYIPSIKRCFYLLVAATLQSGPPRCRG